MKIKKRDLIKFIVTATLYSLLVIWFQFYWLFFGLLLIFDLYFTKHIKWRSFSSKLSFSKPLQELVDWIGAILVALVVVILIRTFLIEAYTIPTPSMENTLMVGDYLFVSKISYGPKLPNTPIAFPFTHNTMPFSGKKSYNDKVQWPYKRLAGLRKIKNNDVVVFNFPEGDSVVTQFPDQNYYSLIRKYGRSTVINQYDVVRRPIDKRENFVKRCIGTPGDTIQIIHSDLILNGKQLEDPNYIQYNYYIRTNGEELEKNDLDNLDIRTIDRLYDPDHESYVLTLTRQQADGLKALPNVFAVTRLENTNKKLSYLSFFPYDHNYLWNEDNFGPLIIPAKGATIDLNVKNLPLYRRIIEAYEKNTLTVRDSIIYINQEPADSYTFTMDYYYMLGDNRHNSADSRIWGFVPEDHIVGKAVFVWLSIDKNKKSYKKFRWKRMFRKIS